MTSMREPVGIEEREKWATQKHGKSERDRQTERVVGSSVGERKVGDLFCLLAVRFTSY